MKPTDKLSAFITLISIIMVVLVFSSYSINIITYNNSVALGWICGIFAPHGPNLNSVYEISI